jgi:glutamate formiminotransferase
MERLVECIPNLSVATDVGLLDRIERAVATTPGTWLLDRTSDVDHARTVFTFVGEAAATRYAMEESVAVAVEGIDMRLHGGQHPRLGAVDVVPFVPLGSTTIAECVDLARDFAAVVAERHELPVYLYGEAAKRPDRTVLAHVRKPGFEGLAEAMARPGGEPDFGPLRPHPSAGAIAVGARPFLIAFNIQLSSADVSVAKRIAGNVRERDGGLFGVQALGLELPSQGCVQVSMNVLDHVATPLSIVWETVERLAGLEGCAVLDSELIGLAPLRAFTDVADHIGVGPTHATDAERVEAAGRWLRIRGLDADMALELRLARVRTVEA